MKKLWNKIKAHFSGWPEAAAAHGADGFGPLRAGQWRSASASE